MLSFLLYILLNFSFSQVVLTDYRGNIYYRENSLANWQIINSTPFYINQGGAIKTEENGMVYLSINNNSEAILYEETAVEIESVSIYYVVFGLVYGKVKINISFPVNSNFLLKTLTSNFLTRRILAVFESDLDGRTYLYNGLGEARFEYRIPHKSGKREFVISQGVFFGVEGPEIPYSIRLLNKDEEEMIFGEMKEIHFSKLSQRSKMIKKLSSFALYSHKIAEKYSRDWIKEKNSDFEAGKTLRDVHGNIVRLEQRILRPSQNEIQFINLIKRPIYRDYSKTSFVGNRKGFEYKGGRVDNRIDFFAATFHFDKPLPSSIYKLPSFFSDPGVNPSWASFVGANVTSNSSFFVAEVYKYNSSRGELINNTEVVGVQQQNNEMDRDIIVTGKINRNFLKDIVEYNFVEKDINSPTGEIKRKTDGTDITGAFWGLKTEDSFKVDGDIYRLKADKYLKGGNGNDYFWITSENYLISKRGGITRKRDLEKNYDLFSDIFRDNFLQSIFYIKEDNNGVGDSSYNSINDNIDLVIGGQVIHSSLENVYEGIKRWKN